MIRSMTGFGRGEAADGHHKLTIEIRSVNHRYSDLNIRLPRDAGYLEEPLRALLKKSIRRGRADLFLSLEDYPGTSRNVSVDAVLAQGYHKALTDLCQQLGLKDPVRLEHILRLPDVVVVGGDETASEAITALAERACSSAITAVLAMRQKEGQAIMQDLKGRLARLEEIRLAIAGRSDHLVGLWRDKLVARLAELLPNAAEVDPARIEQEVAIYADRSDISEELVRWHSHLQQMDATLDRVDGEPVGRRLDFLCQETLREVNTVGSKAHDSEITGSVIAAKEELERVREQLQNIE